MKTAVFIFGLFLASALAGPDWIPASLNLRRVIGAYTLVKHEFEGVLDPYVLLEGYTKVSMQVPCLYVSRF